MDASRIAAFTVLADLPEAELELAAAMREVATEPGTKIVTTDDYFEPIRARVPELERTLRRPGPKRVAR